MTEEIVQLVQLTGLGVTMLLPLANPLTAVSMLLSMNGNMSRAELLRQVRQTAFYVVLIILLTYFVGTWVIHALDISLPGIRIAGGMIVAFIGFNMLFPSPPTIPPAPKADPASESPAPKDVPNIAFVPLALPGTAGPGTIAMIISAASKTTSLQAHNAEWVLITAPILIALFFGALSYVCLRSADRLAGLIGHAGIDAISRIMGFLMVCMGVQLVIDGILEIARNGAM